MHEFERLDSVSMGESMRRGVLGRWNAMTKNTEAEACSGNGDKYTLVRVQKGK